MITSSELRHEITILVEEIKTILPDAKMYCINLVGSTSKKYSLANNAPIDVRDVDVFVCVIEQPEKFCACLSKRIKGIEFSTYRYIDELHLWTFKKIRRNVCFSFHIVDSWTIESIISQQNNPSVYDLSLNTLKLNYPTVYRTWIMEAIYIGGNENILNKFQLSLKGKNIPVDANLLLKKNVLQYLSYLREFNTDNIFGCQIVKNQLLEKIISLYYVENGTYYGTLKSLDDDLKKFTHARDLVLLCNELCVGHQIKEISNLNLIANIESVIVL